MFQKGKKIKRKPSDVNWVKHYKGMLLSGKIGIVNSFFIREDPERHITFQKHLCNTVGDAKYSAEVIFPAILINLGS